MRPHRIHVCHGGEYNGETYIWCECRTPEGESPVHLYGSTVPHIFDALFEADLDEGPGVLLAWLREHGA